MVLCIECQTAAALVLGADRVMCGNGQVLGVNDGNVALIGNIDVDFALAVTHGLFGTASQRQRADDGAFLRVHDRRIRRRMT